MIAGVGMEVTRCLASEDAMHDENAIKMAQRDGTVALIYCQRRAATLDKLLDVAAEDVWIWSAEQVRCRFQNLGMRGSVPTLSYLIHSCKDQQLTGYCIHRVCGLLPRSG